MSPFCFRFFVFQKKINKKAQKWTKYKSFFWKSRFFDSIHYAYYELSDWKKGIKSQASYFSTQEQIFLRTLENFAEVEV